MDSKILPYLYDASNIIGTSNEVFQPKTIEEAKQFVKNNKSICIRGGGTGLAGGAVPNNEPILDLSKLNHISTFDEKRKTIIVEAGVILDELEEFLEQYKLEFPIRPSSHSVCTIGGMIATDAVGGRAGIYGRTSKWVRWIEVINSKGILERKGATELSDFAGMEGITGVIVNACLNLTQQKKRTATLLSFNSVEEAYENVKKYRKDSNVSMIELINPFVSEGIRLNGKYNVIVEYENTEGELTNHRYEELMKKRDNIYPFLAGQEYSKIEDPKITNDKIILLLKWLDSHKIPYFGHISVGIIHPCFKPTDEKLISDMMKSIKKINGQISGEHGIGITKKEYVDPQDKIIIKNIKKRIDPTNKFNNGKIIDLE